MFNCSCPDSLITGSICKHIHLVKRTITPADQMMSKPSKEENGSADSPLVDDDMAEVDFIKACVKTTTSTDISESKKKLKSKLLVMMGEVEKSSSLEALQQLEKQLKAAQNMFISLSDSHLNPPAKIVPKSNAPANKIMEVQPRFYSTKKRTHRTKVCFARPTREEQQSFMVTLKDLPEPASIQNAKTTPSKGVYTKIDPVDNNFL